MELAPNMMMVVVAMIIIGHKCIWGTVCRREQSAREEGKGKERILRDEENGSTLHMHT
jgi:hypothetical protein